MESEIGLVDTVGEGEGGMNSQSSIDLCVLHVKNGVSGNLCTAQGAQPGSL